MIKTGDFKFMGKDIKAQYREDTNDWNTLFSCLNEDEYGIGKLPEQGQAVDLGAHIGGVTLALATKGWKIYAIEMLPENMELLHDNIELNGFDGGTITTCRAAIVGRATKLGDEMTAYYADDSSEAGKAHKFIGTVMEEKYIADTQKHGEAIKVGIQSLTYTLKDIPICDFLKIDIEGAEWEVIRNTPATTLNKIKRIAAEIESLDGKPVSTGDFLKLLPKGFKDVSKEYFPKWCEPSTIIHGYYINEEL